MGVDMDASQAPAAPPVGWGGVGFLGAGGGELVFPECSARMTQNSTVSGFSAVTQHSRKPSPRLANTVAQNFGRHPEIARHRAQRVRQAGRACGAVQGPAVGACGRPPVEHPRAHVSFGIYSQPEGTALASYLKMIKVSPPPQVTRQGVCVPL